MTYYNVVRFTDEGERVLVASFADLAAAKDAASTMRLRRETTLVLYATNDPTATDGSQRAIYDRLLGSAVSAKSIADPDGRREERWDEFEVEVERDYRAFGGDVELTVTGAGCYVSAFDGKPTAGVWTNLRLSGAASIDALIEALTEAKAALAAEAK